jgi:hypothetical protein
VPAITVPRLLGSRRPGRRRRAVLATISAGVLALGLTGSPALGDTLPSGEHILGQSAIEPAYDDTTGNLTYLLTPIKSPFPTHTSQRATAPLYIVMYPPGTGGTFNCMGVPGNCPDHDGLVAGIATSTYPLVYGTNPALVPGHDHLVAIPASGGDFNVAWEVHEIMFTGKGPITHITTWDQLAAALSGGANAAAVDMDLGFAFHCSVVPAVTYNNGH